MSFYGGKLRLFFQFFVSRHYDDKVAEVKQGFWNCPCVPMRERSIFVLFFYFQGFSMVNLSYFDLILCPKMNRKECHCMLFLTKENDFAGEEQVLFLYFFFIIIGIFFQLENSRCFFFFFFFFTLSVYHN